MWSFASYPNVLAIRELTQEIYKSSSFSLCGFLPSLLTYNELLLNGGSPFSPVS